MARVVVAERETFLRGYVRTALERAGHEVAEARDAADVRAALAAGPADLVIVGDDLPQAEGWGALGELLRAGGATRALILCHAGPGPREALPEGATILMKPFTLDALRRALGGLGFGQAE